MWVARSTGRRVWNRRNARRLGPFSHGVFKKKKWFPWDLDRVFGGVLRKLFFSMGPNWILRDIARLTELIRRFKLYLEMFFFQFLRVWMDVTRFYWVLCGYIHGDWWLFYWVLQGSPLCVELGRQTGTDLRRCMQMPVPLSHLIGQRSRPIKSVSGWRRDPDDSEAQTGRVRRCRTLIGSLARMTSSTANERVERWRPTGLWCRVRERERKKDATEFLARVRHRNFTCCFIFGDARAVWSCSLALLSAPLSPSCNRLRCFVSFRFLSSSSLWLS